MFGRFILKPATVYRFEVLSTEEGGNQTITAVRDHDPTADISNLTIA